MATLEKKQETAARMLQLLEDSGLPMPDTVEHGENEVRLLWHDRKVAVVVEIEGSVTA